MSIVVHTVNKIKQKSFELPRDATRYCYGKVVCPSVRDVQVSWSHRLEFFENNFPMSYPSADPNITDLFIGYHPKILAGIEMGYGKSGFGG